MRTGTTSVRVIEELWRLGGCHQRSRVRYDPVFVVGKLTLLFTGDYLHSSTGDPNYDVSRDGRRFLMIQPSARENATPTEIIVVVNWFDELKRLVPTK